MRAVRVPRANVSGGPDPARRYCERMAELVVLQVSDTHLSPNAPGSVENWEHIVEFVGRVRPDVVVHTGDITLNGAGEPDELSFAREHLDQLDVEWFAVPGNHDIGEAGYPKQPVNDERRASYEAVLGDRCWTTHVGGWRFVGTDSQTLMTESESADDEWARLEAEISNPSTGPTAVFLHRPLIPGRDDETEIEMRYVYGTARERLLDVVERLDARLVASGHVHQWRALEFGERPHVWAPSAWAMVPDFVQPDLGVKVVGMVEHRLGDDGSVISGLAAPSGMAQLTMGVDFPSPYAG